MDRRKFITSGATGALGAAALAAPALAQTAPRIRWRCASAFPASLDTIHGGAAKLARYVREATDGGFDIEVMAADAQPGLTVVDAVNSGSAEMCHTASSYAFDKDPTFALGAAIPFMLNARGLDAWLHHGQGVALLNAYFNRQSLQYLHGGSTGTQMGGWFRREINTVQDLNGLKMRIAGLAGRIVEKLGIVPCQLAAPDILPALERGDIDAAEWNGPYDDEKLGFVKVAPYYYYPGWWEGALALCFFVERTRYESLPPAYRSLLTTASRAVSADMLADYDFNNPPALKRLVAAGAQLRPFPQNVLNACFDAALQVYAEIGRENADFKTIYDSMAAFRNETFLYQQVPEYTFDTFMMIKQREGALAVKS